MTETFDIQKALRRAYHLGQNYWADADSESYSANKRADKHRQDFEALCQQALTHSTTQTTQDHYSKREWVELTPEQVLATANNQLSPKFFAMGAAWASAKLKEMNT